MCLVPRMAGESCTLRGFCVVSLSSVVFDFRPTLEACMVGAQVNKTGFLSSQSSQFQILFISKISQLPSHPWVILEVMHVNDVCYSLMSFSEHLLCAGSILNINTHFLI